ncbi:MAG: SWIM zinc finger family protein, partial [Actinobacteria bacterium]|nr:SWIM zinc finger family protein [Actinomycetota bacterium]
MERVLMPRFDPASLADAVGGATFGRGFQYAQQQAVVDAEWDPAEQMLHGMVRGSGGRSYATAAYFAPGERLLVFEQGVCSCPVGFNCKHAVALVLAATAAMAPRPGTGMAAEAGAAPGAAPA